MSMDVGVFLVCEQQKEQSDFMERWIPGMFGQEKWVVDNFADSEVWQLSGDSFGVFSCHFKL